jgi:hypothetical protein
VEISLWQSLFLVLLKRCTHLCISYHVHCNNDFQKCSKLMKCSNLQSILLTNTTKSMHILVGWLWFLSAHGFYFLHFQSTAYTTSNINNVHTT